MQEHNIPYSKTGKVLFLPDLHWRDADKKSIRGYVDVQELIADDIERIIEELGITHCVSVGDLTDKGYRQDAGKYSHTNRLRHWNKLLNGNMIMNIGNHFFLERDANPELYWIQPHNKYHTTKKVYAKEPLLKTPESFFVGDVQFSLLHFDRDPSKPYHSRRADGIKLHVGVYHDDVVLPTNVRAHEHININVSSDYLKTVFANIDHAIFGHIHTPYETFTMQIDGREILADVMGSGMVTKKNEMHSSVMLPVYTIDGSSVKLEYVKLDLKRGKLRFQNEKETVIPDSMYVPQELRGTDRIAELMTTTTSSFVSCETYLMMEGASEGDLAVYRAASRGSLELKTVVGAYKEE